MPLQGEGKIWLLRFSGLIRWLPFHVSVDALTESTHLTSVEKRAIFSLAGLYGFRMIGLFMVLPILALHFNDYQGATPLLLGITLGAYGLTQSILQIPLGLLSDRIGRRPVIFVGLLMFILGSVVAAMAESAVGLIIGRGLQGAGAIASTLMALVTDLTREENRTKAMAVIGGSIGFSFMLSMILGPLAASAVGMSGIFWLTAIFGVGGILFLLLFVPRAVKIQQNRETLADLKHIPVLIRDPNLLRLNIGIFVLHLALMAGFVVIPTLLTDELALSEDSLWWIYLLLIGGGFFAMLPFLVISEKLRRQKLSLLVAIAIMCVVMLVMGLERNYLVTLLLLFLFFAAFNLLEASLPSWLSKVCPVGHRGTAMGIYSTSQFLGAFFGGFLGGWSLQQFGTNGLFFMIAILLLLWWLSALGLQAPKPLKTVVLNVDEGDHQAFAEKISTITGVEDILVIEGEPLAYAKVDRHNVDMGSLKPYFNR